MKRQHLLCALAAALGTAAMGCGDNSKQCGPGTKDENGVCAPDGGDIVCTDGTKLNAEGTGCEIDPNACQDGTVLVDGACVDAGRVDVDVEEAAEPNGLGLFLEDSVNPAGDITLKAGGEATVLHGTIVPHADADDDGQPEIDVDTYTLDVSSPVLLKVSADGLNGLAAGFVSVAAVADPNDPLVDWQRFGLNVTGDTSTRELYIPAAGQYVVAIADTRSLFLTGASAGAEDGAAPFEYYVSITTETATPTELTVTDGIALDSGNLAPGQVKLFTVPMGEGFNTINYNVEGDQAVESVVVTNTSGGTTSIKGVADETTDFFGFPIPPSVSALGIRTGDTSLVVADHVFNYATADLPYDLTIETGAAGALSTDGGDVTQPGDEINFTVFYYDVASDLEITGMDITFDRPVTGVVVNEGAFIFSFFTFDPSSGFDFLDTFQDYKGLLRHPTAGRYYFLVFDPEIDTATDDITAISSYAPVAAVAVTKGTALTDQTVNDFASNPFTYDAGADVDAWQQFDVTGGNGTGERLATFFDPSVAFGHLDPLDSTCGFFCDDVVPLFETTHGAAPSAQGRILLDDPTDNYLLTVRTENETGSFDLDFARRANFTDLGTVAGDGSAEALDQTIDGTITEQLYLLRTDASNQLAVTVTPAGLLDTRFQQLENDESARGGLINNGIAGAPDTASIIQSGEGWTAIRVTGLLGALVSGTFDLDIDVSEPVTYTQTTGTTAFSDACAGGSVVTFDDDDDGQAAPIATPAGFKFFGGAEGQVAMFSNGFATFDTALTCDLFCFFSNGAIPAAAEPNALLAPYWDDLVIDSACSKVDGTKLILQWTGTRLGDDAVVAFQTILDGADDTIEFVYDASHEPDGNAATVGIEDQNGSHANQAGFNAAGTVTPGTSIKFTPD